MLVKRFKSAKLPEIDAPLLIGVLLFLMFVNLVAKIDFYQNDDWVYYKMVHQFRAGDFSLDDLSAPTFYFQGFLSLFFGLIFGFNHIPVLTLLVSVGSFYFLSKLLINWAKLPNWFSILVSLIWFLNPINVYSSLGFMTDNYLLFCLLSSLYFFHKFSLNNRRLCLLIANAFLFFGLMTKQAALTLIIAAPFYFLPNKKLKLFLTQLIISTLFALFYFYIFPKTPEMQEKSLQFHHLINTQYISQLSKAIFIYISAFYLPFSALFVFGFILRRGAKKTNFAFLFLALVASLLFYQLFLRDFKPNLLAWGEFFYLDNVLERKGFYPRGISGTKYHFYGIYDLYKYWDLWAKLGVGFVVLSLVMAFVNYKNNLHLTIFFASYFLLMILVEKVYDRYLPPLFLAYILMLFQRVKGYLQSKFFLYSYALTSLGIVFFLIFYSYQFAMDFVLTNKYVWNKSLDLVKNENVSPHMIKGTNAWKLNYPNYERNYIYEFSFDNPEVNHRYKIDYELLEKKKIDFFASIWIDPYVYLYKKKTY